MRAEERMRLIELEVQTLSETFENYKPGCYERKAYSKEVIKRDVKQIRANLLAFVDDLDAMEGIADGAD